MNIYQNPISNEVKNTSTPIVQSTTLKKLQYRVNIDNIYCKLFKNVKEL